MFIAIKSKNAYQANLASLFAKLPNLAWTYFVIAVLAITIFYLSLVITSSPIPAAEQEAIDRAITLLEEKGFADDVFLLRRVATFRLDGNWLNGYAQHEEAYAATNFPLGVVSLYPDFFHKAIDDTERAMILLHESQHLRGGTEQAAYEYVWRNRKELGWTQLSHGITETYVTIEIQTREHSPHLFECSQNLWSDCTETLQARR